MTDFEKAEQDAVRMILDGIKEYVEVIQRQPAPGGRQFVFLAAAGFLAPDGTFPIQVICNGGDGGLMLLVNELQKRLGIKFGGRTS